jgi:hypothetical protein
MNENLSQGGYIMKGKKERTFKLNMQLLASLIIIAASVVLIVQGFAIKNNAPLKGKEPTGYKQRDITAGGIIKENLEIHRMLIELIRKRVSEDDIMQAIKLLIRKQDSANKGHGETGKNNKKRSPAPSRVNKAFGSGFSHFNFSLTPFRGNTV